MFQNRLNLVSLSQQAESRSQTLALELEDLNAEVGAAEQAVLAAENALDEATSEESEKQMRMGEAKALHDQARQELNAVEEKLAHCSSALSGLKHEKSLLTKQAEATDLEAKKLSVAIAKIQKERSNAERLVATLLKKNAWIESEKSAFGVAGGDYDFEATDPGGMSRQLHALKLEQDSLVSRLSSSWSLQNHAYY